MSIKIEETYAEVFLAFINNQIQEAENKVMELRSLRESIQSQVTFPVNGIAAGLAAATLIGSSSNGYKSNLSWLNKAIYTLKKTGKQMTTGQIADYLSLIDTDVRRDRKRAVSNMSSVLGLEAKKEGSKISRVQNGGENLWDYNE